MNQKRKKWNEDEDSLLKKVVKKKKGQINWD